MNNPGIDSKGTEATLKLKRLLGRSASSSKSAQMCLDEITKGGSINIHPGLANFPHIQRIYNMKFAANQTKPSSIVGFEETLHNFSTFKSPRIKMSGVTGSHCEFVIFTDPDITQLIGCLADPNPSAQSEALSLDSVQPSQTG
jgi:hypothetical protein